jgi:hypothetical protein
MLPIAMPVPLAAMSSDQRKDGCFTRRCRAAGSQPHPAAFDSGRLVATPVRGREEAVRREIWSAADIFTHLVDNIQETFGQAPVEAMAAGLPVVVTDWVGFRDTVRHGVDGMLVRTTMASPGEGREASLRYATFNFGLNPNFGTHLLRRTESTLIYPHLPPHRNLRAVQLLLGTRRSKARYVISGLRPMMLSP